MTEGCCVHKSKIVRTPKGTETRMPPYGGGTAKTIMLGFVYTMSVAQTKANATLIEFKRREKITGGDCSNHRSEQT